MDHTLVRPRAATFRLALSARAFDVVSQAVLRYGLVFLLVGGGLTKFTEAEALTIQPWVAHSPLLGWLYSVTSLQGASILIGVVEIALGVLLAVKPWFPNASAIGSLGASVQFLITFSFLFTTPDLSPEWAGFLSKDLMLFGAAVWTAADALRAARATARQ
jgi:uncharacterized membrane protein YkgB